MSLPLAKRAFFLAAWSAGRPLVRVDGRACSGLPEPHASNRELVLRVAANLSPPVTVLACDDGRLAARLTFRGAARDVSIPWSAVSAIYDEAGSGMMAQFPASPPVAEQAAEPSPSEPAPGKAEGTGRPKLRLVD